MTALLLTIGILAAPLDEYTESVAKWRQEQERGLKRENGWLAVAGLFWLKDGDTVSFALDSKGHLVLPSSARDAAGVLARSGDTVTLTRIAQGSVKVNDAPAENGALKFDADKVKLGDVSFTIIRRGERIGVRVFDPNSEARRSFTGQKWYPIDPNYAVKAKFVAYEKPRTMPITNVLGDTAPVPNPGYVEFTFKGKKCRLEAEDTGSGLFFNFRDLTTGKTTYGAGRFLDAKEPQDGWVVLDFNQAVNPPCAFTDFATCPLPPKANDVPVAIEAGEKTYREHPH